MPKRQLLNLVVAKVVPLCERRFVHVTLFVQWVNGGHEGLVDVLPGDDANHLLVLVDHRQTMDLSSTRAR